MSQRQQGKNGQKNPIKLSCIILSCDSHISKGNSVLHALYSVLAQDLDHFEVILIENSHHKNQDLKLIRKKIREWNGDRKFPILFTLINNKKSQTYGKARNLGAIQAKSNLLVFLDDDTIILSKSAFRKIYELSKRSDCGYGAQRLWTTLTWFQSNSKAILNKMERSGLSWIKKHAGKPPRSLRNQQYPEIQKKTFIANFGFCKKSLFISLGGFPDFSGYGFEDDFLMFRLFEKRSRFVSLDDISVVHVSHKRNPSQESNFITYFNELIKRGYYGFHVLRMLSKAPPSREKILEKLDIIHQDPRIEEAYREYRPKLPLDLEGSTEKNIQSWRENNQFKRLDFTWMMAALQKSGTLNEFIQNSAADFDSLGPMVELAVKHGIVNLKKNGIIKKAFDFHFTKSTANEKEKPPAFLPETRLNQFPCDSDSRKRRADLLKERYPFTEYLRFAIIGDDDFLSLEFKEDFWAWPIILEKDKRITSTIKKIAPRFDILEFDIENAGKEHDLPKVNTFITDPPYTLHGSLAFILTGLKMLKRDEETKEFYVILNRSMMGKRLEQAQQLLSQARVFLAEVRPNFSQYKLPAHYEERIRADHLLKRCGMNKEALEYSSSSNLYIFRTQNPNISRLTKQIDFKKLYQHYL